MSITFSARSLDIAVERANHATDIYMVPWSLPIGVVLFLFLLWYVIRRPRAPD
jgi:hypothetical protein